MTDVFLFGTFRLDRATRSLLRSSPDAVEERIALRPKGFDILCYLAEHAGRIISQDEFLTELWPDTYVQPEVLKSHILAVRTALADRDIQPKYIETARGRGYRFIADVRTTRIISSSDSAPHGCSLLVGRDSARAELELALHRARSGEFQLAFITGEAGIGKTALAESVITAATAAGAAVFVSRCLPSNGKTDAYYPILEILTAMSRDPLRNRLATTLAEVAPTWMVQLPGLAPQQRSEVIAVTPHRVARELGDAIEALARNRLIILVLEDIQWADRATIDLIQALANRRLRARMAIFATLRTSGTSEAGYAAEAMVQKLSLYRLAREIQLQRLAIEDVEAFVARQMHPNPPVELTRLLHQRSEGNPLFMRATLDALLQHKIANWTEDGWCLHQQFDVVSQQTPPDLVQLIEAEIQALPQDAQAVIEVGALAEGQFSPCIHHVAAGVSVQDFERICENLSRQAHLIRRGDLVDMPDGGRVQTYVFQHVLFQEVAHNRQGLLSGQPVMAPSPSGWSRSSRIWPVSRRVWRSTTSTPRSGRRRYGPCR
ncbi:AAA family ATPase (plasmid) [Mesorhizobium sp. ORM8.1]